MKKLLEQDDCAPDSLVYFKKEMLEKWNLEFNDIKKEENRSIPDPDEMTIQWVFKNYVMEIYADSPWYVLYEVRYIPKIFKFNSWTWNKIYKEYLEVLDPDGWDRKNFEYSMREKITRNEYLKRVYYSTCRFNLHRVKLI